MMARINGHTTARLRLGSGIKLSTKICDRELSTKKLWIEQVIHAYLVTLEWVIHAYLVTVSRINGDAPNKEPVFPCNKYTCSRSFA